MYPLGMATTPPQASDPDWERDRELLERWREGDNKSGQELFDRHGEAVIRFFHNKVGPDAQDLIQDTFLRLVATRERITAGVAFRAYLLGIARFVLLEHLRKLGKARARGVDASVDSIALLLPGPSTIAARKLEQRLLIEGLRHLPLDQQILLELYYWEGLKGREIAEVLNIPASTVRGRLARARDQLREAVRKHGSNQALVASTLDGLDDWAQSVRAKLGPDPESEIQ